MSNVQSPKSAVRWFSIPWKWIVLLGLILASSFTYSFAKRTERLITSWRPTNYKVSLTLNDNLSEITAARADITVLALKNSLEQIDLDFGELPIDSVAVNDRTAPYDRSKGTLIVSLPQAMNKGASCVISIAYHGKPKDGLVLALDKAGQPSAVGDNWPNRLHHWIPSFDHPSAKATITFSVTAPAASTVIANGALTRVETISPTRRTWTYTEAVPIPPYCMIIAVGDFARVAPPPHDVTPLTYYVPQTDRAFAMQGFAAANPSLKFFSQTVGPYPYEKLDLIIGATRFGGMENSGAIVFASNLFAPRPTEPLSDVFNIREGLVEIVAHEIAHQWFGDSVTEATWADLWLSEGFADYFAGLFIQRHEGEAAFQRYMQEVAQQYLNFEKSYRRPIHDTETEDLLRLLNANNYQKGAWVLHMLRSEVGDENFFRAIRVYYERHRNATATTEDLRAAFEGTAGQDLKAFFASWIYGAGHPHYEVSWKWNQKTRKVRLVLRQLQKENAFPNVVPIEILAGKTTRRISLKPKEKMTTQELKLDRAPTAILLDPQDIILKEARVIQE